MDGKSSEFFTVNQGIAQSCTISHIHFKICTIGVLCESEKLHQLGVILSGNQCPMSYLQLVLVELAESKPAYQSLIK